MAVTAPIAPSSPFTARPGAPWALPDPCLVTDPADAAKAAGLRYTADREPGIGRRRAGKAFAYRGSDGTPVRDAATLARIKALAIPPAWTDVWICARADGHLQATGRDAKGRKQYRYHPRWREVRDETKYGRMLEFGQALPAIRAKVDDDLSLPGLQREKVLAAVVYLLERTLIRVGNEEYARTNASYGLTTLRDDHVAFAGSAMTFTFRGKSGKDHAIGVRDGRLAKIVRRCRDLPGQQLFQFVDDDGVTHAIGSADVNDYLRRISGRDFTAKDFRTWNGTTLAARQLLEAEPAATERERKERVVRAIEAVAERLGNTPAVCRRCYVHPVVLEAFDAGRLAEAAAAATQDHAARPADERLVLRLLAEGGAAEG